MNHQWKKASLSEVVRYNKILLVSVAALSITCLVLAFASFAREDRWVIIPANDIDKRMQVSNKGLYPSYLKEWAKYIAKEVFTTSPSEVENQHSEIRKISSSTKELKNFFDKQLGFVKSNGASSVFYVKAAKPINGAVLVQGTLHYWFAESNQKVAAEKVYKISYKETERGLILLSNIEEYEKPKP